MLTASACLLSLISAACFFGIAAQKTVSPVCENATLGDIVFLIDGSTNIGPGNFQEMRTFLQNIIKSLDIGPQKVRVGLAQHSDDVRREFLLKEHMDHKSLLAAVEQIPYLQGGNAKPLTGYAIDRIREEFFREEAGSRASQKVPQIAVVITGGESGDEVETPAQRLRQHGVVVFGVGVGKYSQTQLETIANRPPEHFLSTTENFQGLSGLTNSLLMSVCISMEEKRKALANKFADIFFLVDNGLLPQQFRLLKNELRRLVNQTVAGISGYRFGLAQYGQDIKVEFDLNSHQTKKQILKAVENVKQQLQTNQPRNLGNALKHAARNVFTIEKGGRAQQGAEQFLVIVMGKTSDDRVVQPAKAVKSTGVTVVGVSQSVSQKDLEHFASWGFTHNNLKVTELKDMLTTKKVETVTEDCKGANIADIVFVVDESGSIGQDNFQLIRFFLHSVVSSLNVSHATVRVGIVTYSDTPIVQAYLKDYKDKAGILQFINDLSYRGGPSTYTGAALNDTRNKIFQEEQGSRKGVQKVAIVITDGESHDDVRETAIALRRMGVTIYAVGVKIANITTLEMMASHPPRHHVFNVSSFDLLKPLKENLQKSLCNNIIKTSIPKKDVKEACKQKDEADIYFLIDDSGSISTLDFNDMKKFVIEFLKIFHIGQHHVRIGVVKYNESATLQFNLTAYSNAKDVEKAVEKITHKGGGTKTGTALLSMKSLLKAAETRQVPKYLVVITDGESQDQVKGPAETLRLQGVTIFAIGVERYNETQLHEIAGDSKKTFHVSNFDALKSINNDIFTEICAAAVCKDVRSDIFFLTDSSESISEEDFVKMKTFMKSVISKSPIGRNKVQVGVMQFSTNQKLEFDLNKYHSREEIMKAIDDMEQMNGDSQPGKALTEVSKYFNKFSGGRPDLRQVLVLITDNRVNDEVWRPAEALRASGVVIYTVGVMEAIIHQLVQISGTFEQTFIQLDFDALQEETSPLGLALCDPQRECKKTKKADIIFLVDSSTSILPNQFISMQVFMDSIVNLTTVGREQTRFGIILYADKPESKFKLKDSKSRQQVQKVIYSLVKQGGDTYTGEALNYSLQFFNDKHGGRREVPQVLMVITDGEATNPYNLKETSDALRSNQISVFSIGVKNASRDELNVIAGGDEKKVFYVDDFKELETLSEKIFPIFCNSTKPTRCEKSDIVFLLDHSSSINAENITNYATILNFVAEVVGKFEISLEWVRIGLAQFSDQPRHEFYLNDYDNTKAVVERIRNLEYRGGNTYLGKALEHIKDYFKESRGSRRDIPKTLLVISDGDSHDDVEDVADELRKMGIDIFAIGIGGINILRLLQTTGTPERIFHVQNFDGLKSIAKKTYDELCKEVKPDDDPSDCNIDVAVGFDISTTKTPSVPLMKYVTRLEEVVRYVSGIQDACCTSPIQTKIAFHVGPFDSRFLYETNFEAYNEEVMRKVLTTSLSQPSFFDSALLNFFKEKFKNKSTARVKVLLIFSDGLDEEVMKLEQESELLRRSGVDTLLTVALQGANPSQLQMVEFGRGFSHHLHIRIGMPSLDGVVRQQIRAVANRVCCNVTCECTGPEGNRGLHGLPGTKGPSGMKGQQGFAGDEGVPGRRGNPGPSGLQGLQGCPGSRGQKGSRSFSGRRGENGEDGDDAVNGEQGETGQDGIQGERGHPGNPGNPGIRGEPGLEGQRGLRGDPGEPGTDNTSPGLKGEPGNPGAPGQPGLNGRPGVKGGSGNQGPDGRRGFSGETGNPGNGGIPGPPGIPGASGPQGRRGGPGEQGPDGPPGLPGPQGRPGLAGDPGQAGRRGAMGQKGQPGDPGVKGVPGIKGPRGMPGSDGRDGFGSAGPNGAKGDPGFPGYPGLPGNPGLPGSKGDPGRDGNQGRRGNSGRSGDKGASGNPGYPGQRGLRGPPGSRDQSDCELITFIRDNCVCSHGVSGCPAYPTELVFGLDQSSDVALALFERQRKALLTLLEDITIAESSCPTGARVAVVGYGGQTRSLIRFQEHRSKKQLVAAVQDIPWQRTNDRRHLGDAMLFVGQNIFKRVRSGLRMRKVAIFFTNGLPQDTSDIVVAMMVYRALNIIPVVISLKDNVNIADAMKVDDSGNSIFRVLGRPQTMAADLRKIRKCAICYDPCRPSEECSFIQDQQQPQQVEVDLAMVLDGSREMQADEYAGAQQLLSSVVEQLAVSPQPQRASNLARVALVQQGGVQGPKLEFGLQTYQNQKLMRRHLVQNMQQQGGPSVLGQTLDYTLKEVLLKASPPGRRKVLLAVVATQTASRDQARLSYVSQKAKCDGVALFVVTVGDRYNRTQVEELAGLPVQQHLIHVSRLVADEQGYVQRFFRVFLSALSKGMNTYPPVSLRRTCDQLSGQEGQIFYTQQGVADLEEVYREERYQEQTGGQTQTGRLDMVESVIQGNHQGFVSGVNTNARCQLDADAGVPCADYVQAWFFDTNMGACAAFWYGGCGGNANRFNTEHECFQTCGVPNPSVVLQTELTSFPSKDACLQRQDPGSCQNYTMMWFFDTKQSECSRFWYGGCGGNQNRFKTQDECENLCLTTSR